MIYSFIAHEFGRQIVALDFNKCALVSHGVAVIGRRKHGYALSVMVDLVAVCFHFMTAYHIFQVVFLQEVLGHIRPKLNAHAALALRSSRRNLRVGPHEVTHETVLGRLSVSVYGAYIVESHIVFAEEAAVHDQYFLFD